MHDAILTVYTVGNKIHSFIIDYDDNVQLTGAAIVVGFLFSLYAKTIIHDHNKHGIIIVIGIRSDKCS